MKQFLYLILSIPFASFGQKFVTEYESFHIKDYQLVWEHIYETEMPNHKIISTFSTKFKEISQRNDSLISGRTIKFSFVPFLRSIGQKWGNTPPHVQNNKFDATAMIEFKKDRYRVTLSNIKYYAPTENDFFGDGAETDLAIRSTKGTLSKSWMKNIGSLLHKCFKDQFSPNVSNSDW